MRCCHPNSKNLATSPARAGFDLGLIQPRSSAPSILLLLSLTANNHQYVGLYGIHNLTTVTCLRTSKRTTRVRRKQPKASNRRLSKRHFYKLHCARTGIRTEGSTFVLFCKSIVVNRSKHGNIRVGNFGQVNIKS